MSEQSANETQQFREYVRAVQHGLGEAPTEKDAAVEQWEHALDDLPEDTVSLDAVREADIHDSQDRMEIKEWIEHEVPTEHSRPLVDAWHDLQLTFEEWW